MIVKLKDGKPSGDLIEQNNFYKLYPNISFPFPLVPSDIEPLGYGLYDFRNQPDHDTYEKVVEVDPVKNEYGIWLQTWEVVPMNESEIEEKNNELKEFNKSKASYLLTETDWIELNDVTDPSKLPYLTNKADFIAYRQLLREIAVNPPITVGQWPTKPEEVWVYTQAELPVPQEITMRQARLELLNVGKLSDVDTALAAIPDEQQRQAAQIEWEYATVIERNAPLVQSLTPALGFTESEMDDLFKRAMLL